MRIRNAGDLGAAIREIRKRKGYTLEQTAGVAGVGIRFLSELENGKPTAELDKALRVAALLGIKIGASDPEGYLDFYEKAMDFVERRLGRRDAGTASPTDSGVPSDERRVRAAAARLLATVPHGSLDEKLVRRVLGELKRRRRSRSPKPDAEDES